MNMKSKHAGFGLRFPTRLRELMFEYGKSFGSVSDGTGITEASLRNYAYGDNFPYYTKVEALADYFGTSTDYILGRTDIKNPDTNYQYAGKVTGLTDKSLNMIAKFKDDERFIREFNNYIESGAVIADFVANYAVKDIDPVYSGRMEREIMPPSLVGRYLKMFHAIDEEDETAGTVLKSS